MREVSRSKSHVVGTATVLFFLAALGARAARPESGPAGPVSDRPTSHLSLPDRLELAYEWRGRDQDEKKFLVIFPPGVKLEPDVLEARVEPIAADATTGTLRIADAREWLTSHPVERLKMFAHEPLGYWRHYRVVAVKVTPIVQGQGMNHRVQRLRWVYRWTPAYRPSGGFYDAGAKRLDQGFGAVLSRLAANPDALGVYPDANPPEGELPPPFEGLTFAQLAGGTDRPLARLSIDEKALYRLDPALVTSATKAAAPPLENTQLYFRGVPIPLYLHRDATRPDRPPELIFYGTPSESRYTKTNRYWLAGQKGREPVRMAEAPLSDEWRKLSPQQTFPETWTVEQDNDLILHTDNFLTINEFQWVWGELPQADQPASATALIKRAPETKAWFTATSFALPGLSDPNGQTAFDAAFFFSAPRLSQPVRIEVRINNAPPQVLTLQESADLAKHFALPNSQLRETSNTLAVQWGAGQPPIGESVYFDQLVAHYRRGFAVPEHGFTFSSDPPTSTGWRHYALRGKLPARPLVLDAGDPLRPRVIQFERDARGLIHFGQNEKQLALYRVLSLDDISTPTVEAAADLVDAAVQTSPIDYLIISHHDFLDLLEPLAGALTAAGWRPRVVDVESVYASFSWGLSSPVALKAFLSFALRRWPGGGPAYVLFVGDCTSDYRGDFRNHVKNYVPSFTFQRNANSDKWASEHWFTTVCGTDEFSDVMLGRLSVRNRQDAKTVIDKVVRYRTEPVFDPWRMALTYIADEDLGASFAEDAEKLRANYKPPALIGQPIYLKDFPWEDNFYLPPEIVEADKAKVSPVCTTRILDMFNRGSTFVSYNGHGSPNIWSNYRIWFGGDSPNSDIQLLRNGPRLPFIVNLTCNSGAIDYPEPPWNLCISEDFMRSPTGGAIGLYVPSGPGVPTTHMRLTEELHEVCFHQGLRAFGDALCLTQYRYLLRGYPSEMVEMIKMFLFLGEPALPMQLPGQTFALEADRTVLSAVTGGTVRVSGRSELGAGQKGIVALYSFKDEPRPSAELQIGPDGRFEQTVAVPASDETSTWTVRAYFWNEAARKDAAAWVRVRATRPDVALTRFAREPRAAALRAGEPTTFSCTVANRSPLPSEGGVFRISSLIQNRRQTVGELPVSLAGGEERVFRVGWKAQAGMARLEAELMGTPEALGTPSPENRRRTLDLAVVGDPKCAVEISPSSVTTEILLVADKFERRNAALLGSVGAEPATSITLSLGDETTATAPHPVGTMAPGEVRPVPFQQLLAKPILPREYRLALRYFDKSTSKPVTVKRTERISPSGFPDLVVLGDEITFRDESNAIAFRDSRPTDGHTIFITVPVKNLGGAPADHAFGVEVFDGDPAANGKPLHSVTEGSAVAGELPFLDPGQVKAVQLRWDPFHDAGTQVLFFRVDGENKITESNKANNVTSRTLTVLTKGKLETGKLFVALPTPEEAQKGVQPLDAVVANVGETTVTQVLVDIYVGVKQTPDDRIGVVLLDKIGPKSEAKARLNWMWLPQRDLRKRAATEKFSFVARLKGSTQRVVSMP